MGNRHSTDQGETVISGVSLSQDLQEDIVRDFENKAVQDQWNNFRSSILGRRHDRHESLRKAVLQIEAQRELKAKQFTERTKHVDDALERMNAKFADDLVAVNYDADAALANYSKSLVIKTEEEIAAKATTSPCLGPRAHWMFCAQKYSHDTRPCDAYMAVLEKCVSEAIMNKQ